MKKSILLLTILFFASATLSAQKKLVKKSTLKSTKNKAFTPPKATKEKELPPPSFSDNGAYPMISISPSEQKYENEKICTNCDTLILEAGKQHIVVYDVSRMGNEHSRTYEEQPDKKNPSDKGYFTLEGLVKREWDELHKNFPENDVTYHHVFRNTYIKTSNSANEDLNLLNRQEKYEGFLYWSGKPNDKILQGKKMVFATEQISKTRGDKKTSSYYNDFKQDSLLVENLMKTTIPDENLKNNMNAFLQKEVLNEYILPFQFMDLKNVKTIHFEVSPEKKSTFTFNNAGQLIGYNDHKSEKYTFNYKNNLPVSILKNDKAYADLAFQGNNISLKNRDILRTFQLIGKLFLSTQQFYIEKKNYEMIDLKSPVHWKIKTENNETCEYLSRTDTSDESTTCYSNNQYQLPLTISSDFKNPSFQMTSTAKFAMDESGELKFETENGRRSSTRLYKFENSILKSIQNNENQLIIVNYEFFK